MHTGAEIVHLSLLRGIEDMELLGNITRILADTGIDSPRILVERYPKLYELRQKLQGETGGYGW